MWISILLFFGVFTIVFAGPIPEAKHHKHKHYGKHWHPVIDEISDIPCFRYCHHAAQPYFDFEALPIKEYCHWASDKIFDGLDDHVNPCLRERCSSDDKAWINWDTGSYHQDHCHGVSPVKARSLDEATPSEGTLPGMVAGKEWYQLE